MTSSPKITDADLANRFTYHAPKPAVAMTAEVAAGTVHTAVALPQTERYAAIRAKLEETAKFIRDMTPGSREQSLVITKLEEAMFWANASIARNE
jgi:hypothetical protein